MFLIFESVEVWRYCKAKLLITWSAKQQGSGYEIDPNVKSILLEWGQYFRVPFVSQGKNLQELDLEIWMVLFSKRLWILWCRIWAEMSQLSSSNSTSGQASQTRAGRRRKRPHPPVYGGITNSFSDKNSDFVWWEQNPSYKVHCLFKWSLINAVRFGHIAWF